MPVGSLGVDVEIPSSSKLDCWPFTTLLEIWALYNVNDKSQVLPTWVFFCCL